MAQLWGGRFTKETDQLVYNFNASISFDQKFYAQDMRGSIAHVKMLAKQAYLKFRINMRIFTALWRQHLLIVLENRARNCIQEEAGMIRLHWI